MCLCLCLEMILPNLNQRILAHLNISVMHFSGSSHRYERHVFKTNIYKMEVVAIGCF